MTVWTDWRRSGRDPYVPPHETCSPNLVALGDLAEGQFGLTDLGCEHDRNARDLTLLSIHSWGAAKDNGRTDGTDTVPDIRARLDRFIDFLLWVSPRAGIQQVHDYNRNRVWKCNRLDNGAGGWKTQGGNGPWGSTWAMYVHAEVNLPFFFAVPDYDALYAEWLGAPPPQERPVHAIDISAYQSNIVWQDVPLIPIWHRTVGVYASQPGTGAVLDPAFAVRMPIIEARSDLFGAYCTLADSVIGSHQLHCDKIEPFVRDGYSTQWDLEKWGQGHTPPSMTLVEQAVAMHDERFGVDRWSIYINPYELPSLYDEVKGRWPDFVHWMPGYRDDESDKLDRFKPAIWQHSDDAEVPGFEAGIDANQIFDLAALTRISIEPFVPPPVGETTMPLATVVPKSGPSRILENARLGENGPHQHVNGKGAYLIPVAPGTPDEAEAVMISLTARNAAGSGHIEVWPGDGPNPEAALVTFDPGDRDNNSTIVGLITAENGLRAFAVQVFGSEVTVEIEQACHFVPIKETDGIPAHTHDEYAAKDHDHGDTYAPKAHRHDYALKKHTHTVTGEAT